MPRHLLAQDVVDVVEHILAKYLIACFVQLLLQLRNAALELVDSAGVPDINSDSWDEVHEYLKISHPCPR